MLRVHLLMVSCRDRMMGMGMGINHLQGLLLRMDRVIVVRMETVHRDRRMDRVIMVLVVRMALAPEVPVGDRVVLRMEMVHRDRRMEDQVEEQAGISIKESV